MKKTLTLMLLIGLTALNVNLFGMNEKQEIAKNEKTQISKKDYAKIVAASIGTVWFSAAALTTWSAVKELPNNLWLPWKSIYLPMSYAYYFLSGNFSNEAGKNIDKGSGLVSAILATACGTYLCKKLSALRKTQSHKIRDNSDDNKVSIK